MPVTRKVPKSLSPARWMRASEKRASRWALLLSAKCARRPSLPFNTAPPGEPPAAPAFRRHSKSSVTQAAISSTSALLKALPKRRNRSSMASAMVRPRQRSGMMVEGHGQPVGDLALGDGLGGAGELVAMRRLAAIADDLEVALGDVAMELQRAALGRALGMHGEREDGADVGQLVGDRRIFLGRDTGVVAGALQLVDGAGGAGGECGAAPGPEGRAKTG